MRGQRKPMIKVAFSLVPIVVEGEVDRLQAQANRPCANESVSTLRVRNPVQDDKDMRHLGSGLACIGEGIQDTQPRARAM